MSAFTRSGSEGNDEYVAMGHVRPKGTATKMQVRRLRLRPSSDKDKGSKSLRRSVRATWKLMSPQPLRPLMRPKSQPSDTPLVLTKDRDLTSNIAIFGLCKPPYFPLLCREASREICLNFSYQPFCVCCDFIKGKR